MNKKTTSKASDPMPTDPVPTDLEADRFFDELQARWDEHSRRLDNAPFSILHSQFSILNSPFYKRPPRRILSLRRHLVLLVVALAASICWARLIPSLAYTRPARVVCLAIEAIYLLIAIVCLVRVLGLLIYDPARVSLLSMSRHLRRTQAVRGRADTAPMPILLVAVVALIVASCATTGGDGYAMARQQLDRAAVVENLTHTIDKI